MLRLYSLSIFIFCTNFLFPFMFLFGIFFYFVFPLIFFYDNHQQRERERERERLVILGPIDLIFKKKKNENVNVFICKKMKTLKSWIHFLYSNLFFLTKNKNWIQIQSQISFLVWVPQKLKINIKYTTFLLKPTRP